MLEKAKEFSVEIHATKETIWKTLWEDKSFREWSNIIDEGTYLVGVLEEGSEIQFISSVNGYGVTSFVEKLIPNTSVVLRHLADTKDSGQAERAKDWTGGKEIYQLTEIEDRILLTVVIDIPLEHEALFDEIFPKALNCIKILAEKKFRFF